MYGGPNYGGGGSGYHHTQSSSRTYQNPSQLGGSYSSGYSGDPQLVQWFNAVDTDRSGSISVAELQAALVNG
jgi:peflin